jgi:hypothetical protein
MQEQMGTGLVSPSTPPEAIEQGAKAFMPGITPWQKETLEFKNKSLDQRKKEAADRVAKGIADRQQKGDDVDVAVDKLLTDKQKELAAAQKEQNRLQKEKQSAKDADAKAGNPFNQERDDTYNRAINSSLELQMSVSDDIFEIRSKHGRWGNKKGSKEYTQPEAGMEAKDDPVGVR